MYAKLSRPQKAVVSGFLFVAVLAWFLLQPAASAAGVVGRSHASEVDKTMGEAALCQTIFKSARTISLIATSPGDVVIKVFEPKSQDSGKPFLVTVADEIERQAVIGSAAKAGIAVQTITASDDGNPFLMGILVGLIIGSLAVFVYGRLPLLLRSRRSSAAGEKSVPSLSSTRQPASGKARSGAHRYKPEAGKLVTFADVAGPHETWVEFDEMLQYLRNPADFKDFGANIPKGVLLTGPPGNGKTLRARALAGEAGVPFFHINGSEFVEMFVGVGASRVHELFEEAKAVQPSMIFIDEIDAVGGKRSDNGGSNSEREQTLNQLLVELDGFESNQVIVIAATNRPDMLDPALIRPGRLSRQVHIDNPDIKTRIELFKLYFAGKPFADDAKNLVEHWARLAYGCSCAGIQNACNEAALQALRKWRLDRTRLKTISSAELDEGLLRTFFGSANRSKALALTDMQRRHLAEHEAGHTVLSLANGEEPGRVSILPRGQSGGHYQVAAADGITESKDQLIGRIRCMLGGRAAEMLYRGKESKNTGCSSDLQQANGLARAMVTKYGMSELGALAFADHQQLDAAESSLILAEVRRIVSTCESDADSQLLKERICLDRLVDALIENETLLGSDIQSIWDAAHVNQTTVHTAAPALA